MDFQNASYGTSKAGVEDLLEEIKGTIINEVAEKCTDIEGIKTVCRENWHGTSCERFLTNLSKDTDTLKNSLETLYNALVSEIVSAAKAILDFDQNLIDEG